MEIDSASSTQTFGFYSIFSGNRTYNAEVRVHGLTASSWGRFLGLKHDGTNGIVSTDTGHVILTPGSGKVGIGTNSPSTLLHLSSSTDTDLNIVAGTGKRASLQLQNPAQRFDLRLRTDSIFAVYDFTNNQSPFLVKPGAGNNLLYLKSGKVGMGTTSPAARLHIAAGNNPIAFRTSNGTANFTMDAGVGMGMINLVAGAQVNSTNNGYYFLDNRGAARIKLNDGLIAFYTSNTTTGTANQAVPSLDTARVVIDHLGNVGIGTSSPASSYKLSVNGKIRVKEVVVETNWADFVFADDYQLMPFAELEQSIKQNRRLPGIPSEKEVAENGVSVGEMQAKLLQKIEELTLYVIELKKENDLLHKRVSSLEKQ